MNQFPDSYETERLLVRRYRPGDGRLLHAVADRNRDHLQRFESHNIVLNALDTTTGERLVKDLDFAWRMQDYRFMGVFEKISGAFVAQVVYSPVDRHLPEFAIGYFADNDHQRQGYVTEAVLGMVRLLFEQTDVHRLRIECDERNERSQRVALRCGFIKEAHLRENRRAADGVITGTLIYGRLRTDV
jgi:RimJ/RimL family protein N-acetyltransferase